jgi:hypothetical protein
MPGWLVTFGFGQRLENCYAWIPDAGTREQATEKVILAYGSCWAFIYGAEEYDNAVARFPIREVPFGTPNRRMGDDD